MNEDDAAGKSPKPLLLLVRLRVLIWEEVDTHDVTEADESRETELVVVILGRLISERRSHCPLRRVFRLFALAKYLLSSSSTSTSSCIISSFIFVIRAFVAMALDIVSFLKSSRSLFSSASSSGIENDDRLRMSR